MGTVLLRICVWGVVVAAVLGNLAVMVVLMSGRFTMSVSKFLMCNLAFADFCMGVYLLLIAVVDLHTIGIYFNYAIDWQHGRHWVGDDVWHATHFMESVEAHQRYFLLILVFPHSSSSHVFLLD